MPSFTALATLKYGSSWNVHRPVFPHIPQAMQPGTGCLPMLTISVSMPSTFRVLATSLNAVNVFPLALGLPLINNAFISCFLFLV